MTPAGWIIMLLSIGFVVGLTAWCFYRVLTTRAPSQRVHAPLDIDTHERLD